LRGSLRSFSRHDECDRARGCPWMNPQGEWPPNDEYASAGLVVHVAFCLEYGRPVATRAFSDAALRETYSSLT